MTFLIEFYKLPNLIILFVSFLDAQTFETASTLKTSSKSQSKKKYFFKRTTQRKTYYETCELLFYTFLLGTLSFYTFRNFILHGYLSYFSGVTFFLQIYFTLDFKILI